MAANPVPTEKEKVKFLSRDRIDLKLVYKADQAGYALNEEGRQYIIQKPAEYLEFKGHIYETDDPEKIEFLRNHPAFKGTTDTKWIEEMPKPDPHQQQLMEWLRKVGPQALVQAAEKQFGMPSGLPTADPVAATYNHVQQQAAAHQQAQAQQYYQQQPMQQQMPAPTVNPETQQMEQIQRQYGR